MMVVPHRSKVPARDLFVNCRMVSAYCVLCGKIVYRRGGQRQAHALKHLHEGHRIERRVYGFVVLGDNTKLGGGTR